ncbi:MAG: L,D-transpeptidase family protein [Solirubrobacterales bacterium]|nr:L,D-transpeptidase family protein [Solirubrobacterales bacterium]
MLTPRRVVRGYLRGMRVRSLLLLPLVSGAVVAPATAATPPPAPRIAPGITAGGIDVSNLTVLQAAQKLKAEATPALRATPPVVLGVAGKPWRLTPAEAGLGVNGTKTAEAALARGVTPGDVPLVVVHDADRVAGFVDGIAAKVGRAPRNATLRITLRRMVVRRAKTGRGLDEAKARKQVTTALLTPGANRTLHQALTQVRAPINADDIRRSNSTVLTVDKAAFKVRLFKNLRFAKSYGVATGMPAYPTPSGLFRIQNKQVNPTWSVPNSPWAGELQGTTVAGGTAANPLKARWMGIVNGVGFHGTGQEYSIGSRASHGCLRMRVADVIALYKRVPVGTPVLIR